MKKNNVTAGEYSVLRLCGIDDLGRKVTPIKGFREDRKVGIFYFFWAGQEAKFETSLFDIQRLLDSKNEEQLKSENDFSQFYYCGEPLYGYYNMQDTWVLKRHMEMLTFAGIDFICIDCTNVKIYADVGRKLFPIIQNFIKQGFKVPRVTFYTNTYSGTTVKHLYETYYKEGLYDDIWYKIDGKPLIIGVTENNGHASDQFYYIQQKDDFVKPEHMEYFTVKESQWPSMYHFGKINMDAIPWMSWQYPQPIHNGGYIAVPVAQHGHPVGKTSVSLMRPESSRGYNNITGKVEKDKVASGLSYQQMWDYAISNTQAKNAFICGFNEWIAQKQGDTFPEIKGQFVDVYNHEYSRDIEPMRGGYKDNFYIQTIINVRRFKESNDVDDLTHKAQKTIDIFTNDLEKEFDGAIRYQDFAGDVGDRDCNSSANECVSFKYVNQTGRNDITDIFVASNEQNLYVLVKTANNITEKKKMDYSWMNLYLGTSFENSFHGFNYLVNRKVEGDKSSIERYENGDWKQIGTVNIRKEKNLIAYKIPLELLGQTESELSISIKATDNVKNSFDIMSFYESGDVAPLGRLGFLYGKNRD